MTIGKKIQLDFNSILQKVLGFTIAALLSISLSLTAFSLKTIVDIDKRLSVVESNKFTTNDAMEFQKIVNELKVEIATLPSKFPITELENKLDKIKDESVQRDDEVKKKINEIENILIEIRKK